MRFRAAVSLLLVLSVAGCADLGAIHEATDDQRQFSLAGQRLVIHNHGGELRLVAGREKVVVVQRSLRGKATLKGNSSWSLTGDTLTFDITCSGFVPDCGGRHIVSVPAGVATVVTSDAAVRAVGIGAALTVTVSDASLRVERSAGPLRLKADSNVDILDARSTDIAVASTDRSVHLTFAAPPARVEARAAASVDIVVPAGAETYRVTSKPGRSTLASDPASKRLIMATAGAGHIARVRKAA